MAAPSPASLHKHSPDGCTIAGATSEAFTRWRHHRRCHFKSIHQMAAPSPAQLQNPSPDGCTIVRATSEAFTRWQHHRRRHFRSIHQMALHHRYASFRLSDVVLATNESLTERSHHASHLMSFKQSDGKRVRCKATQFAMVVTN